MDLRSDGVYCSLSPSLVVPSHFFCNESSTLVAIYDEPLGEETDGMALIFPGDVPGSSPQRVVPERVGTRTLVFSTPVYTAANRGVVEVLPVLGLASGEVELPPFKIGLKHPIRNVMELCINHSTNEAVLPVLISLMVHCDDGEKTGYKRFQDPHIDRIMATLVGSRPPGSSTSIKDILLPSRKWMRMNLADFGREFGLREMEKQAYILKTERLRWVKRMRERSRAATMAKHVVQPTNENKTGSLPLPRKRCGKEQIGNDEDVTVTVEIWRLMQNAKWMCKVVEDYQPSEPGHLALKTGQKVYIIDQAVDGMCYGVCDGECGYFPQTNVHYLRTARKSSKGDVTVQPLRSESNVMAGQPITDESELKQSPIPSYTNMQLASDSESSDPGTGSLTQLAKRIQRMKKAATLPEPIPGQSDLSFADAILNRIPAESIDVQRNTNTFPFSHFKGSNTFPTGPLSPLATHAHKFKAGLKKTTFVYDDEDSSSETSELTDESDSTPEETGQAGPSQQQRHTVRDDMSSQTTPALASSYPQSRRNQPVPQPCTKSENKNAGDSAQSSSFTQPPPHSNTTELPTQSSKAFKPSPYPHDQEHPTGSNSHPGHKARSRAMGVSVLPVAAFPSSKGHSEADSGWSSAVSSTDTDTKTVPQDDEEYDDITIHYIPQ